MLHWRFVAALSRAFVQRQRSHSKIFSTTWALKCTGDGVVGVLGRLRDRCRSLGHHPGAIASLPEFGLIAAGHSASFNKVKCCNARTERLFALALDLALPSLTLAAQQRTSACALACRMHCSGRHVGRFCCLLSSAAHTSILQMGH